MMTSFTSSSGFASTTTTRGDAQTLIRTNTKTNEKKTIVFTVLNVRRGGGRTKKFVAALSQRRRVLKAKTTTKTTKTKNNKIKFKTTFQNTLSTP